MKRFLLFLSFLSAVICGYAQLPAQTRYGFSMESPKATLSGVAIFVENGDTIKGSLINEFGISAMDFQYLKTKDKIQLVNVIQFLNKWYIKPTLKNDIKQCLYVLFPDIPGRRIKHEILESDSARTIINTKRNIKYSFYPIENSPTNNDVE